MAEMIPELFHLKEKVGGAGHADCFGSVDPALLGESAQKSLGLHKYGCLMAVLPDSVRKEITDWSIANILDCHLAEEGRELAPHITIKYGFTEDSDSQLEHIRNLLLRVGPFDVKLGALSLFKGNEEGDVLKIDVESWALRKLNAVLSISFPNADKHPEYIPHITIAYLDPPAAELYAEELPSFCGKTVRIEQVEWSGADGTKEILPMSASAFSRFQESRAAFLTGVKSEGAPCQQGETAERSGCIPASGESSSSRGGGDRESSSPKNPKAKPTPLKGKENARYREEIEDAISIAKKESGTRDTSLESFCEPFAESLAAELRKRGERATVISYQSREDPVSHTFVRTYKEGVGLRYIDASGVYESRTELLTAFEKKNDLTHDEEWQVNTDYEAKNKTLSAFNETSGGALVPPAKQGRIESPKLLRNREVKRISPTPLKHKRLQKTLWSSLDEKPVKIVGRDGSMLRVADASSGRELPDLHHPSQVIDVSAFARQVNSAARGVSGRGKFGDRVFINYVRNAVGLPRSLFDRLLMEAHREGLVDLSRADMVEVMDPNDVRDSQVSRANGIFNFIRPK